MARIRTLNFLPEVFQTPTNNQFLGATLDQLVNPPTATKMQGYIGSRFGYGVNANDKYVVEPTKTRRDYQLDPGVVFTKKDEMTAKDFISYPGMLDALTNQGALVNDNNKLFTSEIYSWDPFVNLDTLINYNQYYWIPEGLPAVNIATTSVYNSVDYLVEDQANDYLIRPSTAAVGTANPQLTLLRGGTYRFVVNQDTNFWIQTERGTFDNDPFIQQRQVYGVDNNGAKEGTVTFAVPAADAQNDIIIGGDLKVDLISSVPFANINGKTLSQLGSIDGVTGLENLTVLFYNTGIANEQAFTGLFYNETPYDTNDNTLVEPLTITVTDTTAGIDALTVASTSNLKVNNVVTFTGVTFGGINQYSGAGTDVIYYVKDILGPTQFSVSLTLNGPAVTLSTATGTMTANINEGLYEEGFYSSVNSYFYTIKYIGDPTNPTIRLTPTFAITSNTKITANYGNRYSKTSYYKNNSGFIIQIPNTTAYLTTLYYQDGSNPNKVGTIKIVESNVTNTLDVETQIIGKKNFSIVIPNGQTVDFTNGLKVSFSGDIIPAKYTTGEYYVQGVGTAIELVPVTNLTTPEPYTQSEPVTYDSAPYDTTNFDSADNLPKTKDYITIARNSGSYNAWSRSNRWFHSQVINATAAYNNNPNILTNYATEENKANRPIIEFYPNLKLFDLGTEGKAPVDFIDRRTTDAFNVVNGQAVYYPDVEVYTDYTASITPSPIVASSSFVIGQQYKIKTLGTTNWNTVAGTVGQIYNVGDTVTVVSTDAGTGTAYQFITSTTITVPAANVYNGQVIKNPNGQVQNGLFQLGQYISDIADYTGSVPLPPVLPNDARISAISGTTTFTLTVYWEDAKVIPQTVNRSVVANDYNNENYSLFNNARVIFAADTTEDVRNKIYVATIQSFTPGGLPVIALTEASDGDVKEDNQAVILRGYFATGKTYYFYDTNWNYGQQKTDVNQPPLFDIFDKNGISFSNKTYYQGSNFAGNKLFAYELGSGTDDVVLGFPLAYSALSNVGDISFDVAFNSGIFKYINTATNQPTELNVSTGYVYDYLTRDTFKKLIGYQTSVAESVQYQLFEFDWSVKNPTSTFTCDVKVNEQQENSWPVILVAINNKPVPSSDYQYTTSTALSNVRIVGTAGQFTCSPASTPLFVGQPVTISGTIGGTGSIPGYINPTTYYIISTNGSTTFTLSTGPNGSAILTTVGIPAGLTYSVPTTTTTVSVTVQSLIDTKVQISLLSDQVSETAYYSIPVNLNNNPFNENIQKTNIGDIRRQYTSIFYNNPNFLGTLFGSNNYRDLGNLVPWGDKIIQNSASLPAVGAFNRLESNSVFDALLYNSREYVKFKTLLVDTVNKSQYLQHYTAAYLLDDALDQITATKSQEQPFFWSDMLPSKAPYVTNTYKFANFIDTSYFPLSTTYNFKTANYNGLLVYLTRKIGGVTQTVQLIKDVDYIVSETSPSLKITKDLQADDTVLINEYNQTYGTYVPNTPTKLGMYPATIPTVILDSNYTNPTYFILGHDGSYNKLYGTYNPITGALDDYRDQVLLEFEKRVYNNLKLEGLISPVKQFDFVPGAFRTTDFTYDQWLEIYSSQFLDWIGQNRLDYKQQIYNKSNPWTYNWQGSQSELDRSVIQQGYWRGMYQYYYDTTTPESTPWQMLGYANKPTWWEDRYGPAPYTSNNSILWADLEAGYDYGTDTIISGAARPGLSKVLPVDGSGNLLLPWDSVVKNYNGNIFQRDWAVGDEGPVELSYRRSSTYPFDYIRIYALMNPAKFFNLCIDLDNYRYNTEFGQYLVNDRGRLILDDVEIYGNGTPKTSYINWIVDYQKQQGIDATTNMQSLLYNLDVRLVYRVAGFTDKTFLKFFVEKATPTATNTSLLIPDASFSVLLYENQPFDKLVYTSVIVQITDQGYKIYGNSQKNAYFTVLEPVQGSQYKTIVVEDATVRVTEKYSTVEYVIPYGTTLYSIEEVAQFLMSYGAWLEAVGAVYDGEINGVPVTWTTMVEEFLYWAQSGWEIGSTLNLNPSAITLVINRESAIVQPLTIQKENFVLNQNLFPIVLSDLAIVREDTKFSVTPLNVGDSISYGQFNISNIEHGIVFDNLTEFNDVIYNLVTGLRQNRIYVVGNKTAEWDGTMFASGFIYNQDNIQEWSKNVKYTKGAIVKYKNKYWSAIKVIQPALEFQEKDWIVTDYNEVQKGLLPNSSTRSYESTIYYDINKVNLESEADVLSFGLIGYRPRNYMQVADLTDVTQVNVFKNLIKNKGTKNAVDAFKGANLPQGGIQYETYENWGILSGKFGGVLNDNFIEIRLNENDLTGNPATVSLTNGVHTPGMQQYVPLNKLFNYSTPILDPNVLPTTSYTASTTYPDAGYVNYNDVKMSAYFYSNLPGAVNKAGNIVPIEQFYVRDYVWLANYLSKWNVYTPEILNSDYNYSTPATNIINLRSNLNGTATVTFNGNHNLSKYDLIAIINFNASVNGYYVVADIVTPKQILITFIATTAVNITGQGTCLKLISQRVDTPADIQNLPLLSSEFTKNTVWVDENNDGNWAVYRKSLNYQYEQEFTKPDDSQNFGSSVAYDTKVGYLIGDAGNGEVYRYDIVENKLALYETLTGAASFGAAIAHNNNTFVISQPTTSPKVYIYTYNDTLKTDSLLLLQQIAAPGPITNWGSAIALSDDGRWLFISDVVNNNVYIYRKQNILLNAGYFNIGETYTITTVGTTDFTAIGAIENKIGITFVATGIGSGTGTATQCSYKYSTVLSTYPIASGDNFGSTIATDYYADTLVVGAPNIDYTSQIQDWGKAYVFERLTQNFEVQNSVSPQIFEMASAPPETTVNVTDVYANNAIQLSDATTFVVNDPVIFQGNNLGPTGIIPNYVYYVASKPGSDTITIKTSRCTATTITLTPTAGITNSTATSQLFPLYVTVNGEMVQDNNYAVVGNNFVYTTGVNAGDIISVSTSVFKQNQVLTTSNTPRIGVRFGTSVDVTSQGTEIIVGAPYELSSQNYEGGVHRFTNGGAKYGIVTSTSNVNLTAPRKILINGYLVKLPIGNAGAAAAAINAAKITNVQAKIDENNSNILIISLINSNLANVNHKLEIDVTDAATYNELGFTLYTATQLLACPHPGTQTQFGSTVKFNENNSFVVSAPVATRFAATTFDFIDDENQDNDTLFDNNATRWVDTFPNAGAVYMFDYLPVYNESLTNSGAYTYAQSVNARDIIYGKQPRYGQALEFNANKVMVGVPNFRPDTVDGQVVVYNNATGIQDWTVYRSSSPIIDINRINNVQIFSAETNNTLANLDYIDPLQGKIFGAVRQNINYVSNADPASYNNGVLIDNAVTWGKMKVGQMWFDTTNTRFINYHQNDPVYNANYWGTMFPGSDPAIYTWVESTVPPNSYVGPGTVKDATLYNVQSYVNQSNVVQPLYYFWVRNTNILDSQAGKTLSDTVMEYYLTNPQGSGIEYFLPLLPNSYALVNCNYNINANDSILNIGYSGTTGESLPHQEYTLIRANFADDFLPGVPNGKTIKYPESLYDRLLDSLTGIDEQGSVVPNPFLPKAVQSGVLARPRQSFFYNRYLALKNYIQYANAVMKQNPIVEMRPSATFLTKSGEYYNTADFVNRIDWWAEGYDNNTKPAYQVQLYSDLGRLNVATGTIVRVLNGGSGFTETYQFKELTTTTGTTYTDWVRIGIFNGTYEISSNLYDYSAGKYGFDGNFYDTSTQYPFDTFPSEETRWIVRALNEQIFTDELLEHRNKSLILLFEYITSETNESQNYLPWLTKTSLLDVKHTVRELVPTEKFRTDSEEFLSGYLNEVKPYHVVIKEFLLNYTGAETYQGNLTDFDLPATYNTATETYQSPELLYGDLQQTSDNQYPITNNIWGSAPYYQWAQNYGVGITGQDNYPITTLADYLSPGSTFAVVKNASGFPVNGTIKIVNIDDPDTYEIITYASVDRALNLLLNLVRGVNGTTVSPHLPNSTIYMDLPPVIVLETGSQYAEPPKVTAYIDKVKYPNYPRTPAQLQPIMSGDRVIGVEVISPGAGYPVLPEIQIEPALKVSINTQLIDNDLHTIQISDFTLNTGDLVRYYTSGAQAINFLEDGQWYYVNLIENNPTPTIALYTTYQDAINDDNRVPLTRKILSTTNQLWLGAKASAITSSQPVRENIVRMKFDRNSYFSKVTDWKADSFYGSFFAGDYESQSVASWTAALDQTQPNVFNVLASAEGFVFPIVSVDTLASTIWSNFERFVESFIGQTITLTLSAPATETTSGSTIGFYVGMPIKFNGNIGVTGITPQQEYYVSEIVNETQFKISATKFGPSVTFSGPLITTSTVYCYTGYDSNVAEVSTVYDGIRTITGSNSVNNAFTIPLTDIGTGGTIGLYVNAPVSFTKVVGDSFIIGSIYKNVLTVETVISGTVNIGSVIKGIDILAGTFITSQVSGVPNGIGTYLVSLENFVQNTNITINAFGSIRLNQTYFVTSVLDLEHFTVSETPDPLMYSLLETNSVGNLVYLNSVSGLSVNTPLVFNTMRIAGTNVTNFGNIQSGVVYYVKEIDTLNSTIVLTTTYNGYTEFAVTTVPPGTVTIEGNTTYALVTDQSKVVKLTTEDAIANMTIGMPVSPGQVDGQAFTLYQTSEIYGPLVPTLLSNVIERTVIKSLTGSNKLIFSPIGAGITDVYADMPFTVSTAIGGLNPTYPTLTTYYVASTGKISISCTNSNLTYIYCNSTYDLYNNMPIVFSSVGLGNVILGQTYYVKVSGSAPYTQFEITNYPGGIPIEIGTDAGAMVGEGPQYITVKDNLNVPVPLTTDNGPAILTQKTNFDTDPPTFTVQSVLGGYLVKVINGGTGYAVGNQFTILGENVGGTTPANNVTITVVGSPVPGDDEDNLGPGGAIRNVSVTGKVPTAQQTYYVKVTGANTFILFTDPSQTIPVSTDNFPYTGFAITTATATTVGSNTITVNDSTIFDIGDRVYFTGTVFGNLSLGQPYYIINKPTTTSIIVSTISGGTAYTLATDSGTMTVAKAGSYMWLPEPFFFQASIVRYNNRVYRCVVSNNDQEFIFGKWKEINSGSQELNALDRAIGYYRPTVNMPGLDLPQLFTGLEYPNTTYLGQPFEPNELYPLDIQLQDTPFEQKNINFTGVLYKGTKYVLPSNLPNYSALTTNLTQNRWNVGKISSQPLGLTDISYVNDTYLLTTNNVATPIIRSDDGIIWTTNGLDSYSTSSITTLGIGIGVRTLVVGTGLAWETNQPVIITHDLTHSMSGTIIEYNPNTGFMVVNVTAIVGTGYFNAWTIEPEGAGLVVNIPPVSLYNVAYGNDIYVVVGSKILTSDDSYNWTIRKQFDSINNVTLYGVGYFDIPGFKGFVAVGGGQRIIYNPSVNYTPSAVILNSTDGINWNQVSWFGDNSGSVTSSTLKSVATDGTQIIAVGENGVIYTSTDAQTWIGINESVITGYAGSNQLSAKNLVGFVVDEPVRFTTSFDTLSSATTYYIRSIAGANFTISTTVGGVAVTLSNSGLPNLPVFMYKYPRTATLNDIVYGNSKFVAVGDEGAIHTSTNGIVWTEQTSGTEENLNAVDYTDNIGRYTAVGNNNTIIKSGDGITWTDSQVFLTAAPDYTVDGGPFLQGYGPEELVPGHVLDSIQLTVNTRPGSNWPATTYAHNGYGVVSMAYTPSSSTQVEYRFNYDPVTRQRLVEVPAQIGVFAIDAATGVSRTLYDGIDYTVDWVNQIIILNNPLPYPSPSLIDKLRVDVYNVGNGLQIVQSSTENAPYISNVDNGGFDEIVLPCNYSAGIQQGNGAVRPYYTPIEVEATSTNATTNVISVSDVTNFVVGLPITFTGNVFGGIVEDATYYVKAISTGTNGITVSSTLINGTPGQTFNVTNASGSMSVTLQIGNGLFWTDPVVMKNGVRLTHGDTFYVYRTKASTNSVVCNTLTGVNRGDSVTFNNQIATICPAIIPHTEYTILDFVDPNEFTLEDPANPGYELVLTNGYGQAQFITEDYAVTIAQDGIHAEILLAQHLTDADYVAYSIFGELQPSPLGYTLPETQTFTLSGSTYNLDNFVGGVNPENAVVEVDGLRVGIEHYSIIPESSVLAFNTLPTGNTVAITSFNNTEQQYFTTQWSASGVPGESLIVRTTNRIGHTFDECVDSGSFIIGTEYNIAYINDGEGGANTDFGSIGANVINAGSLLPDTCYMIASAGTSDFTLAGAPNNEVGTKFTTPNTLGWIDPTTGTGTVWETIFTATSVGTGTGSAALNYEGYDSDIVPVNYFVQGETYTVLDLGTTTQAQWNKIADYTTTAGSFTIGTTYIIKTVGNTDFTLIGAANNIPGTTFTATGIGLGTGVAYGGTPVAVGNDLICVNEVTNFGTGTAHGPGYFDANISWLELQTPYTTGNMVVGESVVFGNTTLDGIKINKRYYISDILNTTDFTISESPGGYAIALTDDVGAMPILTSTNNVANIIYVNTGYYPSEVLTVTATYASNNEIQVNSVANVSVGQTIQFKTNRLPADQLEVGDTYRIEIVGDTDWNAMGFAGTPQVGDIFTCAATGTGNGVAIQAIYGGLNTTGEVYTILSLNLGSNTITVADYEGNPAILTNYTGTIKGVVNGNPTTTITTGVPHYFSDNDVVRIDGVGGSTQLNGHTYYVHVITPTIFEIYLTPYDPAYNAPDNSPVLNASAYAPGSGGYAWLQGTFVIENTYATLTDSTTNRITVNDTTNLIANTPVYFSSYAATVGENLIGGLLYGTEYYLRDVAPETSATKLKQNYPYEIHYLGNTDWLSLGATANAVFTASIAGTTMTVTSVTSGFIQLGQQISGTGIDPGTIVTSITTGSGGVGVYVVSRTQSVASTTVQGVNLFSVFTANDTYTGTGTGIAHSLSEITVSLIRGGAPVELTSDTGLVGVTQWQQDNVDRLWVTINGYRVPSSQLRLSPYNEVGILATIVAGDQVIITSMTPSETPAEERYINFVSARGEGYVYRVNSQARTWSTEELDQYETELTVADISHLTNIIRQTATAPVAVDGYMYIGLNAHKNDILAVEVYNITKDKMLSPGQFSVVIEATRPTLKIKYKPVNIEPNDNLLITIVEGNTILINGEQIKLASADLATNTLTIAQRGANGTGVQKVHPKYSTVYGLLAANRLSVADYGMTWNPIPGQFNATQGDPLQIADTAPAIFLKTDIT